MVQMRVPFECGAYPCPPRHRGGYILNGRPADCRKRGHRADTMDDARARPRIPATSRLDLAITTSTIRLPGSRILCPMPTYDYLCEKCGHAFEVFQSMSDKPLKTCPKDACARKRWGKGKVHRQIGAGAGLIFKGSGFYITDYRSESYKKGAKKDSESTKQPAEKKSGSGDAKKSTAKSESKKSSS